MSEPLTRAAVLVPISGEAGVQSLVLTQRPDDMPSHGGQVAFPGGKFDPRSDDTLVDTALREAFEEIGLRPDDVEVLGALPEVRTLSSGFAVTPFVGRVPEEYEFTPCSREVAAVFRMPLRTLRDPRRRTAHTWRYGESSINVPAVLFEGHVVWGLTLRIIDLLLESEFVPEAPRGKG